MNFETMSIEDLEARKAAIGIEVDAEGADLDALEAEARGINEELEKRKAAEAQREEIRSKVAAGAGETKQIIEEVKGEKSMTLEEIRSSKEYLNAYVKYLKTGNIEEIRGAAMPLLTENATNGTVPIPTYVEGRIRTAWDKLGVMNLVRKTFIKGNLKVGFEAMSSGAVIHAEGAEAPNMETLVIASVLLVPQTFKKWISTSDEVMDLDGQEFLDYIIDEISFKIAQLEQNNLISKICGCATGSVNEAPVNYVEASASMSIVAQLLSKLSDEAVNPVIVMNRASYATFKQLQANANYGYDPFEGLPVFFDSSLAVAGNTDNDPYLIVGDFGTGALANYPNGADIRIKVDDVSQAPADMIVITGRRPAALGVVTPYAFAVAIEPEA